MILNLKIVKDEKIAKEKNDYNRIQLIQKYGKNYSSDISFIVFQDKYTWWGNLKVSLYYKKEDSIVDSGVFPHIDFGIRAPFNLNLYIEGVNKGYSINYSMEGDKIVLHKEARILRCNFLDYYYHSSESKLELFIYRIKTLGKLEKEKAIPYFIYKPTFIYSIITILFTRDILYGKEQIL
ncbi:MAG: hypothetical protein ABIL45_04395 [candidate division WOR-3 bacterium]